MITRVTGTSVKEIANLVPERLRNQLPVTVQQYSVYSIGSADPFDTAFGARPGRRVGGAELHLVVRSRCAHLGAR